MGKKNLFDRDYRDICYFVDHVKETSYRVDLLRSLGYRLGFNIVASDGDCEKAIVIGKKGEKRIQVTPTIKGFPLVTCVIIS